MAIQKAEALVLKTQTLRSSSLIVTFFTKEFGKLKGIAKGVRREREARGALFELFTALEIVFYEKTRSELHLVSEASVLRTHDALRRNFETIAHACYFSDLADQVCELHDPHPGVYELLGFAFRFLPAVPIEKLSRLFEVKLLGEIGWIPHLGACLECGTGDFREGFFSVREGSVLCRSCAKGHEDARPLGQEVLETLRYYHAHPIEEALRYPLPDQTNREIEKLMTLFLRFRVGYELGTRQFLQAASLVSKPPR
ncbi:MAG: DNA repair protein RecO [Candidatus Omnitrophota bacterium]